MYKDTNTFANGETRKPIVRRDRYDAIVNAPQAILDLVKEVKHTAGWETGITSEGFRRGGYEARSIDIYGYDTARKLAVVQIRRAWKKKESWYTEVSKVYALVGMDEGQTFSHPLASSPRRNPNLRDMAPADVVRWAESKIFGVPVNKLDTIIRQGDIAMVPVRSFPKDTVPVQPKHSPAEVRGVHTMRLRESHLVQVDGTLVEDARDDVWYASGLVEIVHTKSEHKSISGEGRFKIVLGQRAGDPWWLDAAIGD
jgi:hypothetical protein